MTSNLGLRSFFFGLEIRSMSCLKYHAINRLLCAGSIKRKLHQDTLLLTHCEIKINLFI
jgi:hypothetical protein